MRSITDKVYQEPVRYLSIMAVVEHSSLVLA